MNAIKTAAAAEHLAQIEALVEQMIRANGFGDVEPIDLAQGRASALAGMLVMRAAALIERDQRDVAVELITIGHARIETLHRILLGNDKRRAEIIAFAENTVNLDPSMLRGFGFSGATTREELRDLGLSEPEVDRCIDLQSKASPPP